MICGDDDGVTGCMYRDVYWNNVIHGWLRIGTELMQHDYQQQDIYVNEIKYIYKYYSMRYNVCSLYSIKVETRLTLQQV